MIEEKDAVQLADRCFAIAGTATRLPGERDANFRLAASPGEEYVLKVAPVTEDRGVLELETTALAAVASSAPDVPVPQPIASPHGEMVVQADTPAGRRLVRLQTFLHGRLMADVAPYPEGLLRSVGRTFARLDRALAVVTPPARSPDFPWDLTRAPDRIRVHRDSIALDPRRALLDRLLPRIEAAIPSALSDLPRSTIHNDGNERNILVTDVLDGEVCGILDFGDMLENPRIVEPAVCAAYASLDRTDPLRAAAAVVAGYHEETELDGREVDVLYDLIVARLCLSVSVSASRRAQLPTNPYLGVSEESAWAALERWADIHPRFAETVFRRACRLPASDRHERVRQWLERHGERAAPVVPAPSNPERITVLDLSPGSADPCASVAPEDARFASAVAHRMRELGAVLAFGRYDEPRRVYTSSQFGTLDSELDDVRTIHIGVDIFAEAGTVVHAPFDGVVHSVADNALPLDYGPTIILRHETDDGDEYFTLYGHLSRESIRAVSPGAAVGRGERVADLGTFDENGGWPPHLHFQIITDILDERGDFPGVCPPWAADAWLALCPDPSLVLRVPGLQPAGTRANASTMVRRRREHLGPSLSLSYRTPLIFVRGEGSYLFDSLGRRYLDGVNNVCHVGHCHPAVVEAITRQAALLNTNTRYLHDSILTYADRLAGTLPQPLEVCFFTNSGSEANELALRMARAHTAGSDVVVLDGAYHGNTSGLVDISPYKFAGPGGAGRPAHVRVVPTPDLYRGEYRDADMAGQQFAEHVASAIEDIVSGGSKLAAFVAEPIMSCAGQIPLARGFLERAFIHTRRAGGVCIVDEVQTGFGRVGLHFWAFQEHGVVPDIVTMGKPMGNGHPLGAVVTTREIAESFANGMEYFNTFGGNPVACAAGLAVLDVLESERLQERAKRMGAALKSGLRELADRYGAIGDVRGSGLFLGVELVRDRVTRTPATRQASYLVERMKQRGVLSSTDGPDRNVIKIKPPMVWEDGHVHQMLQTLEDVIAEPGFAIDD